MLAACALGLVAFLAPPLVAGIIDTGVDDGSIFFGAFVGIALAVFTFPSVLILYLAAKPARKPILICAGGAVLVLVCTAVFSKILHTKEFNKWEKERQQ